MGSLERKNPPAGKQDSWGSIMEEIAEGRRIPFEEARILASNFYEGHKDLFSTPERALCMLWQLDSWGIDSSTLKVANQHPADGLA